MDILYVNNDMIVEVQGLRDAAGALIAGATVEATLYESDGVTEVPGVLWPLPLVYTGSNGVYRAELPASVAVQNGRRYKMTISAVSVGKSLEVVRTVKAETRYA